MNTLDLLANRLALFAGASLAYVTVRADGHALLFGFGLATAISALVAIVKEKQP